MASEVAKRLRDRRLNVWNEAKGLADSAAEENRAFSAEEQGKWDALNEEIDKLDVRIKSVLETEQRAKDADSAYDALTGKPVDVSKRGEPSQEMAEMRSFFRGEQGAPRHYDVRPDSPVNYRTLSTLTTGAGGNLTPTDFYDQLIAHLIEVSGVMQAGPTVLNTAGGEALQIPKTTSHSTAAPPPPRQASSPPPTRRSASLRSTPSSTASCSRSRRELLDDTGVDLIGYLAM